MEGGLGGDVRASSSFRRSAMPASRRQTPSPPAATAAIRRLLREVWWSRLWLVIGPVRLYQLIRSIPLWPLNAPVCRFEPTCSQYMIDAVVCHGLIKGMIAGWWRILRCNPFGKTGDDPAESFRFLWEANRKAQASASRSLTAKNSSEGNQHDSK